MSSAKRVVTSQPLGGKVDRSDPAAILTWATPLAQESHFRLFKTSLSTVVSFVKSKRKPLGQQITRLISHLQHDRPRPLSGGGQPPLSVLYRPRPDRLV